MKHIRAIARVRELEHIPRHATTDTTGGGSSLSVKIDFLVNLTDRIITIIMQAASGL